MAKAKQEERKNVPILIIISIFLVLLILFYTLTSNSAKLSNATNSHTTAITSLTDQTTNPITVSPINFSSACNQTTRLYAGENQTQGYVCASIGVTYVLGFGNFTLNSVGQNYTNVTIKGFCGGCASHQPTTSNFTLQINQSTNVYCYTSANLQLISVNDQSKVALFRKWSSGALC